MVGLNPVVDNDDVFEPGDLFPYRVDRCDMGCGLGDDDPAARVAENEGDLLGRVGRVDGGRRGACHEDPEVGDDPLWTGRTEQRNPISGLDAQ